MFTGLIEKLGILEWRRRNGGGWRIGIAAAFDALALGESVAVQGVCLTVDAVTTRGFEADLLDETLRRTALGELAPGATVNLERAMKAGSRFGGHIVQGHVDETGRVATIDPVGRDIALTIACSRAFARRCIEKGSVAIDGVSLTITAVAENSFAVNVIPHTLTATSLARLKPGSLVNLESDVIGKYVERFLQMRELGDLRMPDAQTAPLASAVMQAVDQQTAGGITEEQLRKAGFCG